LGLRWLINASRSRKDKKTIADKLSLELIDAHAGRGEAFKKKEIPIKWLMLTELLRIIIGNICIL